MDTQLIVEAYQIIAALTPLKGDCGRLCGSACCHSSEAGDGMLLLPGEEALLPRDQHRYLSDAQLFRFGAVLLYQCPDTCDRAWRPLACRVFPLAPLRKKGGGFSVQMDARGRPVCPLSRQHPLALDPDFNLAVEQAFNHLARDEDYRRYLWALDALIRDYRRFSL